MLRPPMPPKTATTAEHRRLEENRTGTADWLAWGPYLSERQWGTVREDYSEGGDAWDYFPHDQARSRAYRCGEDGITGICDKHQRLCFSLAMWNGVDPILKERMFGLTNSQGNHGEDVKEYWFYLDSTPTHSYMKALYKYPQREFPYADLVATNHARTRKDFEYELIDTGIFEESRYFDVFVEYAKAGVDDILVEITAHNRGPDAATLHLLPTLWFRNTWAWAPGIRAPTLGLVPPAGGLAGVRASGSQLGEWLLRCEESAELLFCENETNNQRLFGAANRTDHVKDGINDYVVAGDTSAVNPAHTGTKMAALHKLELEPGASASVRVRLSSGAGNLTGSRTGKPLGTGFDRVMSARRNEADEFYATVIGASLGEDAANVMRQALAGMLWSKQYFEYDVHRWLREHGVNPWSEHAPRAGVRNAAWFHLDARDVISMPDTWEYPWFAAWDLAFRTVPLSLVDVDFAKDQMELLLKDRYLHPNGQIPAYEWNFSDVNPPLHAWAALYLYERERDIRGEGDSEFLERVFQLLLEFKDSIPALAQRPGLSLEGKRLASLLGEHRLRRILTMMLDESEFLSPHGIRAISRYHADHPYIFDIAGQEFRVDYEPAESHSGMFGGNSNWRGPIWFPMNFVILRGLRQLHEFYGEDFKVECPSGSGNQMSLNEVANEIGRRLASIFLRGADGRRPVFGGIEPFQSDPHWRDLLLFHEYFHGDNGAGLGASHQTGWTGLVALLFAAAAGAGGAPAGAAGAGGAPAGAAGAGGTSAGAP